MVSGMVSKKQLLNTCTLYIFILVSLRLAFALDWYIPLNSTLSSRLQAMLKFKNKQKEEKKWVKFEMAQLTTGVEPATPSSRSQKILPAWFIKFD